MRSLKWTGAMNNCIKSYSVTSLQYPAIDASQEVFLTNKAVSIFWCHTVTTVDNKNTLLLDVNDTSTTVFKDGHRLTSINFYIGGKKFSKISGNKKDDNSGNGIHEVIHIAHEICLNKIGTAPIYFAHFNQILECYGLCSNSYRLVVSQQKLC